MSLIMEVGAPQEVHEQKVNQQGLEKEHVDRRPLLSFP